MHIKVFNGEQAGASSKLDVPAEISVGNHYQCDILVADYEVAEYTHQLQLTENELIFTSLDEQAVYLANGERVIANNVYPLPAYLQFGAIQIGIGNDINDWQTPTSLDEENKPESLNAINLDELNNLDSVNNNAQEFLQELDEQLSNQTTTPANLELSWWQKRRQSLSQLAHHLSAYVKLAKSQMRHLADKYGMKLYIGLGVAFFMLIIIIAAIFYTYQFQKQTQLQVHITNMQSGFKKRFAELPSKYNNLYVRNLTNRYQINGLILNKSDESELRRYFAPYSPIVSFQLITLERAQSKIKAILANHNLSNLEVQYNKEELQLVIRGLVNGDLNQINDLEIDINNQLPQLNNIQFAIYPQQQLIQDLNSSMGEISKFLNIKPNDNLQSVTISGFLTNNQLQQLESNLIPIRQKYQQIADIKLMIKDTMSALPFHIFCVFYGHPSYIITTNGTIVYEGGQIGEFKFSGIIDNKIVLTASNFTLEIPLSQVNTLNNSAKAEPDPRPAVSGRDAILHEEHAKAKEAFNEEKQQLEQIRKYKEQVSDPKLRQFLQEQEANLTQDIKLKQQDLDYYTKELNLNG